MPDPAPHGPPPAPPGRRHPAARLDGRRRRRSSTTLFGPLWLDVPGRHRPVLLACARRRACFAGLVAAVPRPPGWRPSLVLLASGRRWCVRQHGTDASPFTWACAALARLSRSCACCGTPSGSWCSGCWPAPACAALDRGRADRRRSCWPGVAWPFAGLRGCPGSAGRCARRAAAAHAAAGPAPSLCRCSACSSSACCSRRPTRSSASWVELVLPDVARTGSRSACSSRSPSAGRARRGVPRPQPAERRAGSGVRRRGAAPLRVAGAGAARRRGVRAVPRGAGGGVLRRPRLHPAHHRADLRRVRPPGLRPAHRRHRADAARGVGGGAQGRRDVRDRLVAARLAGCAVPADPGRGRSALHRMDLYQDAYGFTRLRLLVDVFEGWLGSGRRRVLVAGLVRWGWLPRFALLSGVVALLGLAAINPDALDRPAQHRPLRGHRPSRLGLPARPLRRRPTRLRRAPAAAGAACALPPHGRRTTTGSRGTSGGAGRPTPSITARRR